MPGKLKMVLTETQREELERMRDHHARPYVRERAAAILKIAAGQSGRQVALQGLLRVRVEQTVYDWFHRYETQGIPGLLVQPGRGRKPAFSPSAAERARGS